MVGLPFQAIHIVVRVVFPFVTCSVAQSNKGGNTMPDGKTTKKIVRVEGESGQTEQPAETRTLVPTEESKGKAKSLRIYSIVLWILGIAAEVGAIVVLLKPPISTFWLIALIVVDLILVVVGSQLWKKANRFDPASEQNKAKFFIQNQLGTIISIIAFLPLVILIFTNKDMSGKQKGIVGAIAAAALVIAGITSYDFNPPSTEQYAKQIEEVTSLTGSNFVYWTKSGTRYHLFKDCSYINRDQTTEIFEGTVQQARELKNITELCSLCKSRMERQKGVGTGGTDVQGTPQTPR
jgi:hypothetical protein